MISAGAHCPRWAPTEITVFYLLFSILIIRLINRIRREELRGADDGAVSRPGEAPPYVVAVVEVRDVAEGHDGAEVFGLGKSGLF